MKSEANAGQIDFNYVGDYWLRKGRSSQWEMAGKVREMFRNWFPRNQLVNANS